MQRALKNLLVQGTLDGAPSSGTLDLSLCTVYLPANISSGDYKQSVRVATTANGTISTAFANGQTVDGITLATGDRILLKDQSSQAANGIYVVAASGSPARASDFDSWLELPGAIVTVEVGTVNAGTQWACNVAAGGTLGSTAITFVVPKNFLDLTSNQSVAGVKTFANVVLTTADINGGTMDAVVIGGTTPAAGTFTTINGNAITGSGTLALSTYTLTATATGNVAITGGNLSQFAATTSAQLAGVLNDETGTGVLVFNNSPSVITPAIQANALSFSTILTTAATGSNKTVTFPDAAGTVLLSGNIGVSVQAYDADLTTWAGITPAANVGTFLATPSGANLASALTSALPVSKGGTGLTAGTSGGILAFTATGTIASSALLAANALMIGGGAGVAPSTTTTGAGVLVANINRPIFATTATAAGTTTLTVTSATFQEFTGYQTHTLKMPAVATLVLGWAVTIHNLSTGLVTVRAGDNSTIIVVGCNQRITISTNSITTNTDVSWSVDDRNLVTGSNCYVEAGSYYNIVSGNACYASSGGNYNIISGEGGYATNSTHNSISGSGCYAGSSLYNSISGNSCYANSSSDSNNISGSSCYASSSSYNSISGGGCYANSSSRYNNISGSGCYANTSSDYNSISGNACYANNGGNYNIISGSSCYANNSTHNSISGSGCYATDSLYNSISGSGCYATNTSDYNIIGGNACYANANCKYNSISGGNCYANTDSDYNSISGQNCYVSNASDYNIISGYGCALTTASYCSAFGRRVVITSLSGVFASADSEDADFTPTVADSFNIRASGGVRIAKGGFFASVQNDSTIDAAAAAVSLATMTSTFQTGASSNTTTTLAAGEDGQRKRISMVVDVGMDLVVTVTNPAWGGAGTITFTNAYDAIELEYLNSVWVPFFKSAGITLA